MTLLELSRRLGLRSGTQWGAPQESCECSVLALPKLAAKFLKFRRSIHNFTDVIYAEIHLLQFSFLHACFLQKLFGRGQYWADNRRFLGEVPNAKNRYGSF